MPSGSARTRGATSAPGVGLLVVLAIPVLSMTARARRRRRRPVDLHRQPRLRRDRYGVRARRERTAHRRRRAAAGQPSATADLPQTAARPHCPAAADVAVGHARSRRARTARCLTTTVIPSVGPAGRATDALLGTLRDTTLPDALHGTGAHGYVTGTTAGAARLPRHRRGPAADHHRVVVLAAFLLLLVCFRSPFLAVKAALLNLVSIGAAYGVVVAVFQWGWGGSAARRLGEGADRVLRADDDVRDRVRAVDGLRGLPALARSARRGWRPRTTTVAVAHGLAATARVISCAAVIMTSVFLAFLLSTNVVVKMLALGLGVSVLVDATVIRLLVVPASDVPARPAPTGGSRGWLDRILPHLDPEGHPDAGATAERLAADAPAADDDTSADDTSADDEVPERTARRRNAPPTQTACLGGSATTATRATARRAPRRAP